VLVHLKAQAFYSSLLYIFLTNKIFSLFLGIFGPIVTLCWPDRELFTQAVTKSLHLEPVKLTTLVDQDGEIHHIGVTHEN
jgi:hypothetical protein